MHLASPTPGYHRLRFADRDVQIAVAPGRCVSIADVAGGRRRWGLAVQLYSLAREGDGGIGDTTALRGLLSSAARHGADAVAISPVHSLFAANGRHVSPYAPSNRLFLNPLYADPSDALPGVRLPPRPDLERMDLIDWPAAARAKYAALREIFEKLKDSPPLHSWNSLLRAEIGCASTRCSKQSMHTGWAPADARPTGAAGRRSGKARRCPRWRPSLRRHRRRFSITSSCSGLPRFLHPCAGRARDAGMRIGLIADLAIGMDPTGSHAWTRPGDLLTGLSVGAPPDIYIPSGQDWGLVASRRWRLSTRASSPSSPRCGLPCAMRAACGSIMRWG